MVFFDKNGDIDWIKPTWPKVQRHFWIWAIPVLVGLAALTITFSSLAKHFERSDGVINGQNQQSVEWPEGAHYDGIGNVDGCAVVYSEKGYFAVIKDDKLERMLYTGGSSNGIYRSQIFSIQDNGEISLYTSDGEVIKTFTVSALPVSFKEQTSDRKQTITIDNYTYEIQREQGIERVTAKSSADKRIIVEKKYVNTKALRIIGYVSGTLGFCLMLFYFVMNVPAVVNYLEKHEKIRGF